MNYQEYKILLAISVLLTKLSFAFDQINDTVSTVTDTYKLRGPSEVLSRRKRFIVFPDGSSFQLVFCAQNQGYFQIGDIFWLGNTAALAWELPTDPKIFHFFKNKDIFGAQRRDDNSRNIVYVDENGKTLAKIPYHKKFIVNPAFARRKRNSDFLSTINKDARESGDNVTLDLTVKKMHDLHLQEDYLRCKDEECNAEFHREGRKGLYEKLETLLEALGWRGRECVLRMLCDAGRSKAEQGTFLEEIIRAVFTLPGGQKFSESYHQEYDEAHTAPGDCAQLYSECENKLTGQSVS